MLQIQLKRSGMLNAKHLLLLCLVILGTHTGLLQAQIVVTPNSVGTQLAQAILGSGIIVSNVTMNCPQGASGTFTNTGTSMGVASGVLLTSGSAAIAAQGNLSGSEGQDNNTPGDADLDLLSGVQTFDACALEFDFVALCDTISIAYVFGSEEYDEFTCSNVNDAFGFFLTGPGYANVNIATVPNSTTPVSINTVNFGTNAGGATNCVLTNTAFYQQNLLTTHEYDGQTVRMRAVAAVNPCATYHVKLVIADGGDGVWDSGVFLEQNGILCENTLLTLQSNLSAPGLASAIEGCVNGEFVFNRQGDTTQPFTFNVTVGGTATYGVDYNAFPTTLTFPANVTSLTIPITANADALAEGMESIIVIVADTLCGFAVADTATLFIDDQPVVDAGPDRTVCEGIPAQLGAAAVPTFTYNWTPATGLSNPSIANPTVTLSTAGTYDYVVTVVNLNGCTVADTVRVTVNPLPTLSPAVTDVSCFGDANGSVQSNPSGGTPGYTFAWSNGPATPNLNNVGPGTYTVTVTDALGCQRTAAATVVQPTLLALTITEQPILCFQGTGSLSANASGGTGPYSYLWSNNATTQTATGLLTGTYAVTVADQNGCTVSRTFTLSEPAPLAVGFTTSHVTCFGGNDGSSTALASGGTGPYNYFWSNGSQYPSATLLTAGIYQLTVTDANGCTLTSADTVLEAPLIVIALAGDLDICVGDSTTLSATVTGGAQPYAYQWFTRPANIDDSTTSITDAPSSSLTYYFDIRDAFGCVRSDSVRVIVRPLPEVAFTGFPLDGCDTLDVDFQNLTQGGQSYLWDFGHGLDSRDENPSHTYPLGHFNVSLIATSEYGCVARHIEYLYVNVIPSPIPSFTTDPDIRLDPDVLLSEMPIRFYNTSLGASSFDWDFGNAVSSTQGTSFEYSYPDSGNFVITLTGFNELGCPVSIYRAIHVILDPGLWVPTAFTPGDDDLNDLFLVSGLMIQEYQIWIYDRWGKLLYNSKDIGQGWDGRFAGQELPEGVYTYHIVARDNLGNVIDRPGTVTLIR